MLVGVEVDVAAWRDGGIVKGRRSKGQRRVGGGALEKDFSIRMHT